MTHIFTLLSPLESGKQVCHKNEEIFVKYCDANNVLVKSFLKFLLNIDL